MELVFSCRPVEIWHTFTAKEVCACVHARVCVCACTHTVPLESNDRVPHARARVHVRVSVNSNMV